MDSSSSSASSGLSCVSSPLREPTPEWDSLAAYDILAPTKWDEEDHASSVWSEDDKSLTDGEDDFQFLVDGELEAESEDDSFSWDDFTSSDEEEEEESDTSSDEPRRSASASGRTPTTTRTTTRRKRPLPRATTDDTSSGEVEEILMPSITLDLATSKSVADKAATLAKPPAETQEPIISTSAAPMVLGEGYDLSSLLTFDPESTEPAASKASEESGPSATHGQLQHLKALLSSSIETLVEDTEDVKSILEDIQPHVPVTLQRLNEKKAALDAKTDTSVSAAELETLRKELEDLEERVRVTKQLIQDKEALIARSHEEAADLKAELKTDLAEIRALNKQLVTGQDEDDEGEIAEVDRVRVTALRALEAFLQ
ncbi:hypothetical protein QYE76_048370 [Lolium multiflorum]|uniref:Uncharacterized protein n=1 Tax=Lolium multiflorum TaxID=4521 RepID=A0AAD8SKQ1_LOLMU|nr:hypothetical protein QYE76_048370 [Lolium multiflorum]